MTTKAFRRKELVPSPRSGITKQRMPPKSFRITGTLVVAYRSFAMQSFLSFWTEENGQDIAEYAVMLAVILVLVVGTVRLIGSNANTVFSNVASSVQ
jgi:Flp pilus assembly pilin Flp